MKMIYRGKIKQLQKKIEQIQIKRDMEEKNIRRMFRNENYYRFEGHLIPESSLRRIIGD